MATGVVGKGAADEHSVQKLPQLRILASAGSFCKAFGSTVAAPLSTWRAANTLSANSSVSRLHFRVVGERAGRPQWSQLLRLPQTCHHPPLIVLSPSVAESQPVSDHGPDSSRISLISANAAIAADAKSRESPCGG